MKINLNKSTKRALSLVLALAMLAGSLFTANVGININASAETAEGVEKLWDGNIADRFSDTESKGTKDDPIEISEPGELAFLANGAGSNATDGNLTHGKYYKIADGIKAFNMNGMEGITINSSIDAVDTATPTTKTWDSVYSYTYLNGIDNDGDGSADYTSFDGYFDGNGIIVYNIYGTNTSMGLFPAIDGGAVIENITVKNSVFNSTTSSSHAVGGIFGFHSHGPDTAYIRNCTVENVSLNAKSSSLAGVGTIAGSCRYRYIEIQDCLALNNKITTISGSSTTTGIVGRSENSNYKVINTVSIGDTPVVPASNIGKFSNVYTTNGSTTTGVTLFGFDDLKGTTAQTNMPTLDWSGTWFANDSYPVLRVFHTITATPNTDGTHSEECDDCGLVGLPANHFYNEVDKANNITKCSCGAYIKGIFDIWDSEGATAESYAGGKGTEDAPYIIETVEQLFKMVSEAGEDENGNPQYYKVADGVTALYINDTRGYTSQTEFEAAAAVDSINNWSEKMPTGLCADTNCGHTRPGSINLFTGYFDGNGVTIYGLYSKTTSTNSWVNGTGFVPGMVRNSTIKNVIFDTSYVKSSAESAAVVCSSFGLSDAGAHVNAGYCCDDYEEMLIYKATPSLINIAVRNAYVESKSSMPDLDVTGDGEKDNVYSFSAGITANYAGPKSLNIQNCLFDGTNSTLVSDTGSSTTGAEVLTTSSGIFSSAANWVYTTAEYCVSIGADVSNKAENISAQNSYTTDANATSGAFITTDYATVNGMPLLNWVAWDINAVETYGTPMPKLYDGWEFKGFRYYKNEYKNSAWYDDLPYGHSGVSGAGYEQGIFSGYEELVGSGTEADPYIIDNAQLLFEIIASGGTHRGIPQYFKLACDIDLGGVQWVNYQTSADLNTGYGITYYQYKPFAGTIDGDGHTITGMYTATTDTNAGFIPELAATGVVKNLHFRNSYAYTSGGKYGIIAGSAAENSKIIGCSIEGGVADKYIGTGTAAITDSYCGSDVTRTNETLFDGTNYNTAVWYKGESGVYRLFNKALAMPCADIDGDGNGYEYNTNDLTALKGKLLKKSEYANVYGDVSRNGVINIRDMAILQREVVGDDVHPLDGFWKNVKAGKFNISYGENDNYDAARKLQLYFEEVAGVTLENDVDIKSDNGDGLDIIIETVDSTDSSLGGKDYSVSYDIATAVLSIKGVNFTAVEQAVLNFIAKYDETTGIGSDMATGKIYEGVGSLSSEVDSNGNAYKQPITVTTYTTSNENGSLNNDTDPVDKGTYYYVWGDEFETDINGTVSYDNWLVRDKGGDDGTTSPDTNYINLKLANADDLPILNAVSGGKLTMHRGVSSYLAPTSGEASGTKDDDGNIVYFDDNDMSSSGVLTTRNSLLFKRGYLEMQATLPNDDYAFPAWWLLTNAGNNNLEISRSLYSKVYEENTGYDNNSLYFSSDDYTTYQYKLPTSTFEIDLFEIINNPNGSGTRNAIFYNLHKWYNYSETHHISGEDFKLYELAWDKLGDGTNGTITNFNEQTPLLEATYENNAYSISSGAQIKYHTDNAAGGQINAAINEKSGTKYGTFDEELFTGSGANNLWKTNYTVNMIAKISGTTVTEYKYGFLWTEDEMTYIIKGTDGSLISSVTVNCADLGYDNGSVIAEQYAYFLIDNHFYTNNGATISSDAPMTIDYVRLYQLDGERDIVTPETERDNVQSR